MRVPVFAVWSM